MIEPQSLIAERLGGADYDGDMVKVICESVASHYKAITRKSEDRFSNRNSLPLLSIPTAEPQIRNANDWYVRFETVRSTFSSRVGQIFNAALDRSMLAYDETLTEETARRSRRLLF